jgi:hypothetical protein
MQETGRSYSKSKNPNVCAIGQGEARHRKYKRLKLSGGQAYDHSVSNCCFWQLNRLNTLRHRLLHSPAVTEIPAYFKTKCWVVFCEWCVKCVYFLIPGGKKERNLRWNTVWYMNTNLYKKRPTPPLTKRRNNEEKTQKVLILNGSMATGPPGLNARKDHASSKLLLLLTVIKSSIGS